MFQSVREQQTTNPSSSSVISCVEELSVVLRKRKLSSSLFLCVYCSTLKHYRNKEEKNRKQTKEKETGSHRCSEKNVFQKTRHVKTVSTKLNYFHIFKVAVKRHYHYDQHLRPAEKVEHQTRPVWEGPFSEEEEGRGRRKFRILLKYRFSFNHNKHSKYSHSDTPRLNNCMGPNKES